MAGFIGNRPTGTSLSGSDISDDSIESADIKAGTIVNSDINASAAIATSKVSGAVTSIASHGLGSLATLSSVDTAQLTADAVDGTKIADDSLNSEHYVDGSIDTAHLSADCVDGTKIADDSINSEHLVNGSVDDAHLATGISSSKLTGALPAISGASLTNLPASGKTITESTSDPAITTNPSDGVGALFLNKNDGELFCCTDATSNQNVWVNIGSGSGNIPIVFQGTNAGFTSGGHSSTNVIDTFSFALATVNATDHGDLTVSRNDCSGQSSATHGYTSGGNSGNTTVDKFGFSSSQNATDVGDLTVGRHNPSAQSSISYGYGYASGGTTGSSTRVNIIDRSAFASDGNSTDQRDLSVSRGNACGQSSSSHGYTARGHTGSYSNVIDKFSFASTGNASDIADSVNAGSGQAGNSSVTHGYTSGGEEGQYTNQIEKFSFSSDSNATDVGDLTVARGYLSGMSSTTYGYQNGGHYDTTTIDRFSFSSDGNASDVGDLSVSRRNTAGQQY